MGGWAVDLDAAEQSGSVDVVVNDDRRLRIAVGGIARPDVAAAHATLHARWGFRADISGLLVAGFNSVEVRFSRTGELLNGGKFQVASTDQLNIVHRGVGDHLFLKGDRNSTIDQISGAVPADDTCIAAMASSIVVAERATRQAGGKFAAVIVPDKAAAAPHLVAADFPVSEERPAIKLAARAADTFGLPIKYPLADVRALSPKYKIVLKTDTHLSMRALNTVFERLTEDFRHDFPIDPPLAWRELKYAHDLANCLADAQGNPFLEVHDWPVFDASQYVVTDTRLKFLQDRLTGNARIVINPSGQVPLVLLYGTSSCRATSAFVERHARMTVHIWHNSIDIDLVRELAPNYVFLIATEKTLLVATGQFEPKTVPAVKDLIIETRAQLIDGNRRRSIPAPPQPCVSAL